MIIKKVVYERYFMLSAQNERFINDPAFFKPHSIKCLTLPKKFPIPTYALPVYSIPISSTKMNAGRPLPQCHAGILYSGLAIILT